MLVAGPGGAEKVDAGRVLVVAMRVRIFGVIVVNWMRKRVVAFVVVVIDFVENERKNAGVREEVRFQ